MAKRHKNKGIEGRSTWGSYVSQRGFPSRVRLNQQEPHGHQSLKKPILAEISPSCLSSDFSLLTRWQLDEDFEATETSQGTVVQVTHSIRVDLQRDKRAIN